MRLKAAFLAAILLILLAFCSCNPTLGEGEDTGAPSQTEQAPSFENGEGSESEVTTGKEYSNNY